MFDVLRGIPASFVSKRSFVSIPAFDVQEGSGMKRDVSKKMLDGKMDVVFLSSKMIIRYY